MKLFSSISGRCYILAALLVFFTLPSVAAHQKGAAARGTIIVDFTELNSESGALTYRIFNQDLTAIVARLNGFLPENEKIDVSKLRGAGTDEDRTNARNVFLQQLRLRFKRAGGSRWLSGKNDTLDVFVFFTGKNAEIKISESKRKTRIAQDVSTLTTLIVSLLARSGLTIAMEEKSLVLKHSSGKLDISVTVDKDIKGVEKKEEKMEIITGPTEHWFLSADLITTKLSEVKFVSASGTIEPKETPKVFYLGLNWMIGDILKERQCFFKHFFIKGMLQFSKKPLDSYGVGIGFRFPSFKVLGINSSAFSVFAAMVWSKEQIGEPLVNHTKRQVQFGISFNLDKGLGWIK